MWFENICADLNEAAKWNTAPTLAGKLKLLFDTGFHAVLVYRFGAFANRVQMPIVRQFLLFLHMLLHFVVHPLFFPNPHNLNMRGN